MSVTPHPADPTLVRVLDDAGAVVSSTCRDCRRLLPVEQLATGGRRRRWVCRECVRERIADRDAARA